MVSLCRGNWAFLSPKIPSVLYWQMRLMSCWYQALRSIRLRRLGRGAAIMTISLTDSGRLAATIDCVCHDFQLIDYVPTYFEIFRWTLSSPGAFIDISGRFVR